MTRNTSRNNWTIPVDGETENWGEVLETFFDGELDDDFADLAESVDGNTEGIDSLENKTSGLSEDGTEANLESVSTTQASVESEPIDGTDVARKTEVDEKTDQTEFDNHSERHESGGSDVLSIVTDQIQSFGSSVVNSITGSDIEPNSVDTNSVSTGDLQIGDPRGPIFQTHSSLSLGDTATTSSDTYMEVLNRSAMFLPINTLASGDLVPKVQLVTRLSSDSGAEASARLVQFNRDDDWTPLPATEVSATSTSSQNTVISGKADLSEVITTTDEPFFLRLEAKINDTTDEADIRNTAAMIILEP